MADRPLTAAALHRRKMAQEGKKGLAFFFGPERKLDARGKGQVFTPDGIVREMLALRQNKGSVLEPASGEGAFLKKLRAAADAEANIAAVELDPCPQAGKAEKGIRAIQNIFSALRKGR